MGWGPGALGRRRRTAAFVAFGLAWALGLTAWLAARRGPAERRSEPSRVAVERSREAAGPLLAGTPRPAPATRPVPTALPAARPDLPPPEVRLREAVLEADREATTDPEILDADRLIQGVLRARPQLAATLAALLPELQNRGLALRIALLLGRFRLDPAVRAALLQALEGKAPLAREVAAYSFYGVRGDPEVARALADGFTGAAGPPPTDEVRAAHAFALSQMLPDLPEPERQAVRARAREALAPTASNDEVRREAVTLVDTTGPDRERLRQVLAHDPERSVAFAAARVLAQTGEGEAALREALSRFQQGSETDVDRTRAALRALLAQPPAGTAPPPGEGGR